jgi:hypothetical protein
MWIPQHEERRMKTFIAAVWLFVTPAVFGQGQTQNRNQVPVTPAARSINWRSASALKALFVDLNADGWLELVALVGGGRPSTGLEIVFQTPGGVPLPDRLTTTYDGFVMRELVDIWPHAVVRQGGPSCSLDSTS